MWVRVRIWLSHSFARPRAGVRRRKPSRTSKDSAIPDRAGALERYVEAYRVLSRCLARRRALRGPHEGRATCPPRRRPRGARLTRAHTKSRARPTLERQRVCRRGPTAGTKRALPMLAANGNLVLRTRASPESPVPGSHVLRQRLSGSSSSVRDRRSTRGILVSVGDVIPRRSSSLFPTTMTFIAAFVSPREHHFGSSAWHRYARIGLLPRLDASRSIIGRAGSAHARHDNEGATVGSIGVSVTF